MNKLVAKFNALRNAFHTNVHLRVGFPFIAMMCIAPTLMEKFVEIQFMFGKSGNADRINEEILLKQGSRRTKDEIIKESFKEMIEDRRDLLEKWEPVRVNRSWEEQDDTFKHYVTLDDLRLKD